MLELRNITKKYEIGSFKQAALNGVDLAFKTREFVAVLGPSGSGKTTLLNLIGGLDRYDEGDLLIDGKSTREFSDQEWDSYRNHEIGFIFQNYNLISHISVLANVEIGLTLTGLSPEERRKRSEEVLGRVGLIDHIHKKPNQLSGGQMQRVAIARALVNDPEIILADEPTGAIDNETSRQIMELIQQIAKDKLVIMVTHDEAVAKGYANRIVSLSDGVVTDDTRPPEVTVPDNGALAFDKTSMSFLQALKLSFSNLKTKKFRTLITAIAGSIGIIGVALVLAIANGMNNEIDELERTTLAEFPLQIDPRPIDIDAMQGGPFERHMNEEDAAFDEEIIYPLEQEFGPPSTHTNDIDDDYMQHLEALDESLYNEMSISYDVNMNLLKDLGDDIINIDTNDIGFDSTLSDETFFEENYNLLAGDTPEGKSELLLIIDSQNRVDAELLEAIGLGAEEEIPFETMLEYDFHIAYPDDYYIQDDNTGRFAPVQDKDALIGEDTLELNITGIARLDEDAPGGFLTPGLKYHPDLEETYLERARTSDIGEAQLESDVSVITGLPLSESAKEALLKELGVDSTPAQIQIYPVDFSAKNTITDHLDAYNTDKEEEDEIRYTDIASIITELSGDIIDGISYVLVAFSAISLLVSSIMIGIITYVSVLERTREIGILRSLGARKRDILRVFNAETTIIGFTAGLFGVLIATGLTFPINRLIAYLVEDLENLASLPLFAAAGLILISIILTFTAGLIPSSIASRKDPVSALRVD